MMKTRTFIYTLGATLLLTASGCSKDENQPQTLGDDASTSAIELVGTYPKDGQTGVSSYSEIQLTFDGSPNGITTTITPLHDSSDRVVLIDEGTNANALRYTTSGLEQGGLYEVQVRSDNSAIEPVVFTFYTEPKPATEAAPLEVVHTTVESSPFPLMTMSSFHFQFSEWLDTASIPNARFELTNAAGESFDMTPLSSRNRLALSPNAELLPGTYTLTMEGLTDLQGGALVEQSYTFPVLSMGEMSRINSTTTVDGATQSFGIVEGAVTGTDTTQLTFDTGVYLGDGNLFDGYLPVLIKRGSIIKGSALDVRLNGAIPTDLSTGDLTFTVINDSVGYLVKNEITDDFESPQQMFITMDLAMQAADPRGNGLMTQNNIGLESSGLSTIKGKKMRFNVAGALDLNILETGQIGTNINLVLETTPMVLPDKEDFVAPSVQATFPADGGIDADANDTFKVIFAEAMDPRTLQDNIVLHKGNDFAPVNARLEINGAEVLIVPEQALDSDSNYRIEVAADAADFSGNTIGETFQSNFRTAANPAGYTGSPKVMAIYPGVNCTFVDGDLSSNIAGRCANYAGAGGTKRYSVFNLPADHALSVWFSMPVKAGSHLSVASSCDEQAAFRVERVDWTTGTPVCLSAVGGSVALRGSDRWVFTPYAPLEVGASYQLVVNAGSDQNCDANEICGMNNKSLDTNPLVTNKRAITNRNITIPFVAEAALDDDTFQTTYTESQTDLNGNGAIDRFETPAMGNSTTLKMDLCDSRTCTDPLIGGLPPCSSPGVASTSPLYTCNADDARTELGWAAARFTGTPGLENKLFTTTAFPVTFQAAKTDPLTGEEYMDVRVPAGLLESTGYNMIMDVFIDIPVSSGPLFMRTAQEGSEGSGGDLIGRITNINGFGAPRMTLPVNLYMDAPYLEVPTGGDHDLKNTKIQTTLSGDVEFDKLGNIRLQLANEEMIKVNVEITNTLFGTGDGNVALNIEPGEFKLDLIGSK